MTGIPLFDVSKIKKKLFFHMKNGYSHDLHTHKILLLRVWKIIIFQ